MTLEDAYDLTIEAGERCSSVVECEANKLAAEALKFRIDREKKLKPLEADGKPFHRNGRTLDDLACIHIVCPDCGNDNLYYKQNFCDCCGHALAWDD